MGQVTKELIVGVLSFENLLRMLEHERSTGHNNPRFRKLYWTPRLAQSILLKRDPS
jgi:hypothetical protein